jgi:hypothetical protein
MIFHKGSEIRAITNRKLTITGGEVDIDYSVSTNARGVLLYTADKELLTKGKKHVIILVCKVVPVDRMVAVKVHSELYKSATVTGPSWIDPDDSGEIVLSITPRVDMNLAELDYIVKLFIEKI